MPLTYENVAKILKLIDSSQLQTFEIDVDGMRLVVRRGGDQAPQSQKKQEDTHSSVEQDNRTQQDVEPKDDFEDENISVGTSTRRDDGAIEIRAPMIGTFYRAPSPSEPPYVDIGATISAGDALCIIEVMKLFTTIEAEQAGTVIEIPAENGELVQQGDILFVVKTD